jgi:protein-S-isoprenylcysteine O-methyltransferase Ste14
MHAMASEIAAAENPTRLFFARLLELDNKIIGFVICATAAYDWFVLYHELDRAALFYRFGFYALVSLNLLSILSSAVFLTCTGLILLALQRPLSRYQAAVPNLVSILAAFTTYLFVWTPTGNLMQVNVYLAYALIIGGSFAMLTSLLFLRRAFSVTPQARLLVTSGPYSLVRHPMYVGSILLTLGLTFLVDSPQAIGLFFICACLQIWRALYEERLLEATFTEYRDYKKRVGRFVPKFNFGNTTRVQAEAVEINSRLSVPGAGP